MAQHKRAFEVAVAPLKEQTDFQDFVVRLWKPGAVVLVAIAAAVLFVQVRADRSSAAHAKSWDRFRVLVDVTAIDTPEAVDQLARAADELDGTGPGVWAQAMEVMAHVQQQDYESAKAALGRLRQAGDSHWLLTERLKWGGEAVAMSLPDFLGRLIEDSQGWESSYPRLFHNPVLPPDSPRVRLNTTSGEIVVGLYANLAPKHVENFLELVGKGFYDGTSFHRVVPGSLIQGGDPNTREADPAKWGQGGPGYGVEPEDSGLFHFKGYLAAAKAPGSQESSGSQFYITVNPCHQFDGDYTVFGVILEGDSTVAAIGGGAVQEGSQRPEVPVLLESAVRL